MRTGHPSPSFVILGDERVAPRRIPNLTFKRYVWPMSQSTPKTLNGQTNLKQALDLEAAGYSPVPIYAAGEMQKSKKEPAKGKEPFGPAWGLNRRNKAFLLAHYRSFPDHGIGICFGPGRAPGGRWLIDLEGDGERAAESLAILLAGSAARDSLFGLSPRRSHYLRPR